MRTEPTTSRRRHRARRSRFGAAALLAGISFLPGQQGGISLLDAELHADRTRLTPYGNFATPHTGPDLSLAPGTDWQLQGLSTDHGSDPAVAGNIEGTLAATTDTSDALAPGPTPLSPGGMDARVPRTRSSDINCGRGVNDMEASANYWNAQLQGGMPVPLSPMTRVAGPGQSPDTDDQALSLKEGPAGAWCRAMVVAGGGPFPDRALWAPLLVILFGVSVFWLSRGVRLPS